VSLSFRQHVIAACAVLALAACGKGGGGQPSQVAAKVNGDEITVHQINDAVQRLGNIPESQAKQAQKEVLERLVDQQLLVRQAINKKLDRDPRVVATIEAAKRQILAQAYVEQVTGAAQKASASQIQEFYAQHPELFRERRVYRFAQMAVAAPSDKQEAARAKLLELDKQADKQKILSQFADWLKAQDLQFRVAQTTQTAEQLPIEELPKYQQMKVGDLLFSPAPQGALVSQLVAVQAQPISQEQAQPVIEQYLQNRDRMKLSEAEMKRLRAAAKIEYIGPFAKLDQQASASQAPAGTGSTAVAQPVAGEKPAPGAANAGQSNVDQDAIANSVKALK
jgi:EpsD family peptidyl-prolyl cis-trans isomerase